jgi:hypothetical protein
MPGRRLRHGGPIIQRSSGLSTFGAGTFLDTFLVQNQSGNYPLRWGKRGTVMKCEGFDMTSTRLKEQKEQKLPETVHSFSP